MCIHGIHFDRVIVRTIISILHYIGHGKLRDESIYESPCEDDGNLSRKFIHTRWAHKCWFCWRGEGNHRLSPAGRTRNLNGRSLKQNNEKLWENPISKLSKYPESGTDIHKKLHSGLSFGVINNECYLIALPYIYVH